MTTTEEIVYSEAVRAIQQQPRALDELRSRTAIVLAASGVISAVFGQAAAEDGIGAAGAVAILGLVVVTALCIAILMPQWKGWTFSVSAKVLLSDHVDIAERNSPAQLHRYLAERLEEYYDENDNNIEALYRFFWWACIALAADIGVWLLELVI